MYIPFKILKELWAKENLKQFNIELDASDTQNAQIFRIDGKKSISVNLLLTDEYLQKLEEQKVENISVYYNPYLMKVLKRYHPQRYHTEECDTLAYVEKLFFQFEYANKLSSYDGENFKKRYLKILQDIVVSESRTKRILAMYNELLDTKLVEKIKASFPDSVQINYVQSERGILMLLDSDAYKTDPKLVRLQFLTRKVFNDVNYTNIKIVEAIDGFKEYFQPSDAKSKKLILLVGKTPNLLFLYKQIKLFDPFSKIIWLSTEHLKSKEDQIFDSISNKLNQDYSMEMNAYTVPKDKKTSLSQNDIQKYRKYLAAFGRKFNFRAYIELAYDIQQKSKEFDMFQPKTHLMNILLDLRYTPEKIFDSIINK